MEFSNDGWAAWFSAGAAMSSSTDITFALTELALVDEMYCQKTKSSMLQ